MLSHATGSAPQVLKAITAALLLGWAQCSDGRTLEGTKQPDRFNQLDQDGNGYISYPEAQGDPALRDQFNQLDKDKNGELDRGEFAQFEAPGGKKMPDTLPPKRSVAPPKTPPPPPPPHDQRRRAP